MLSQPLPINKIDYPKWLQRQLEKLIPVTARTGFYVVDLTEDRIELFVPLSPNVNDKLTLFGGVSSMMLTLAGWALISYKLVEESQSDTELVVAKSEVNYTAPMKTSGATIILSVKDQQTEYTQFLKRVKNKERASFKVRASLFDADGTLCATQKSTYVSFPILIEAAQE